MRHQPPVARESILKEESAEILKEESAKIAVEMTLGELLPPLGTKVVVSSTPGGK